MCLGRLFLMRPILNKQEKAEFNKALGWQVKSVRQLRGMSQAVLAERLVKSYQTIQKYEDGSVGMPVCYVWQCSRISGVPVGYFFREDNSAMDTQDRTILRIARELSELPKELRQSAYQFIQTIKRNVHESEADQDKAS